VIGTRWLVGLLLLAGWPGAQTTQPASSRSATVAELVRVAYPVEPELLQAASVRLRNAGHAGPWQTAFLEAPASARVDPGDGTGHRLLVEGAALRRLPGGGEEPLADADRAALVVLTTAARAALLWPLLDAVEVVASGISELELRRADGGRLVVERSGAPPDVTAIRTAESVVRLRGWHAAGRLRVPQGVTVEIGSQRSEFEIELVSIGWAFNPGLFLQSQPAGRATGAVDPSGRRVGRWERLDRPRLLHREAQTWLVFEDPLTWDERGHRLGPVGLALARSHQVPDGMPLYYRGAEGPRVAIPFKPAPRSAVLPLPEELLAHRVVVPAVEVVAVDIQGDPEDAGSVLVRLLAFCRDQGLRPDGPARFVPSLAPGEKLTTPRDQLTTRVELPVRR
jgi:hypothetical protein